MSLRYADRHPKEERTPSCFGRVAYYNPNERECRACAHEYECRDQIAEKRRGTSSSSSVPVRRHEGRKHSVREMPERRGPDDRNHAGIILEGETPFQRFGKDCVTGAFRGFFEEGADFFRYWRW